MMEAFVVSFSNPAALDRCLEKVLVARALCTPELSARVVVEAWEAMLESMLMMELAISTIDSYHKMKVHLSRCSGTIHNE